MAAATECFNLTNTDLVVITDVRFAREADAVRAHGGVVAGVVASDKVRRRRLSGVVPRPHVSEEMDFEPDVTISNQFDDHDPLLPVELAEWVGIDVGQSGVAS